MSSKNTIIFHKICSKGIIGNVKKGGEIVDPADQSRSGLVSEMMKGFPVKGLVIRAVLMP